MRAALVQFILDYPISPAILFAVLWLIGMALHDWKQKRKLAVRKGRVWSVIAQMIETRLFEAKHPIHGGPLIWKPWDATLDHLARDVAVQAPNFHVDLSRYSRIEITVDCQSWQQRWKLEAQQRAEQEQGMRLEDNARLERDAAQAWIEAHDR